MAYLRSGLHSLHGNSIRLVPFRSLQAGFSICPTVGATAEGEVYLTEDLVDKATVDRACAAFNAVMEEAARARLHGEHAVERALEDVA